MATNRAGRTHENRVALVTGAAQGIGQAICCRLAERGAHLVGVDVSDLDATGRLVKDVGGDWLGVMADVTDPQQVMRAVHEATDRFGSVDILVNNAAIDDPLTWDELDLDRWRRVLIVDVEAPFLLAKAVVPLMAGRGWGRIVNIGSGSVLNPMPKFVAYRTAKAAIIGFSRALATEVGERGITVNVVSPGITRTAMAMGSLPPGAVEAAAATRAIKRVGEPDDVADAVLFLTGDDSAFVTGQTLLVNGGACFG